MEKARRRFLQKFGLGLAATATAAALPDLLSLRLFNASIIPANSNFSLDSDDGEAPVDRTLERLLRENRTGNPFVAEAACDCTFVEPLLLYGTVLAVLSIYDRLGIPKAFSGRVGYRDASQCRRNFEQHEAHWRRTFKSFTDVGRTPLDRDVSYLTAGNISPGNNLYAAQTATQFKGYSSVALTDNDPGVVLAASSLLSQNYSPTNKETAQSFAVTNKESFTLEDGTTGTRYETPVLSYVHDPRTHRRDRRTGRQYRGGVVTVHNKADRTNPRNIYYAGLYV